MLVTERDRGVNPPINSEDHPLFDRIASHYGHDVLIALYGNVKYGTTNAAVECMDCSTIVISQDRSPEDEDGIK